VGVSSAEVFKTNGFAILDLYSPKDVNKISEFAKNWLYQLLEPWVLGERDKYPLEIYHLWWSKLGVEHSSIFKAANRHRVPDTSLRETLISQKLKSFFAEIGLDKFELWDEGLGSLAFRFVRPGVGDGYPMSCKAWGPAKDVFSLWIPVIGRSSNETLQVVPGSHLKDYKKHLPTHTKFTKDEYRLDEPIEESALQRPALKEGEIIIYDPRLLHSEDVQSSNVTRFNLELRIKPQKWS